MTAYHVYSDGETISRFRQVALRMEHPRDDHRGTTVSDEFEVGRAFFATAPKGDHVPLHPVSRRQLLIVLDGEYEFTSTAGDAIRLQRGDLLFADDAEGMGHLTDQLGDVGRILLVTIPPTLELEALITGPEAASAN
jgi:quercetin dioxygenase-like cupin family protein